MELYLLGTGNAFSQSGDRNSAYLLQHDQYLTLLDCGPTILQALYENKIQPADLDTIYISHLHPDHYFGLLFLLLHQYYLPRKKKIMVYGPIGLEETVASAARIIYSSKESEKLDQIYTFIEFTEETVMKFQGGEFICHPALHSDGARMVIVDIGKVKVGYSGDTALYHPSLDCLLRECQIIIHEATSLYKVPGNHTSLEELLGIKLPSNTHLFLSHHDDSVVQWVEENTLPKNFHLARDNDRIDLLEFVSGSPSFISDRIQQ